MDKIKRFLESEKGRDILVAGIVILVGTGSFELGRLSRGDVSGGIEIEYPKEAAGQEAAAFAPLTKVKAGENAIETVPASKAFFASSRGKKYYPVGCSAGKSIKESNKVWFTEREEAERAGYTLSTSCR